MIRVIGIGILAVVAFTFILNYDGFNDNYELIVNEDVVLTASKSKLESSQSEVIDEYRNDYIDECEENIKTTLNSQDEIEKIEYTVAIVENDLYNYTIEVKHTVEVLEEEKIEFAEVEQELDEDETQPEYNEIVREGKPGSIKKRSVFTYIDGEYIESDVEIISEADPVDEIIIVGVKGEKEDEDEDDEEEEKNTGQGEIVTTSPSLPIITQKPYIPESKPVVTTPVTPEPEPEPEPDEVELPEVGYYSTFYSMSACTAYGESKSAQYEPGTTWYECYASNDGTFLLYWFEY